MYSPHTHLDIARARHEDMIREAQRHQLAASVESKRPGLISRVREHLGRREQPQRIPAAGTV
jgi:hypothetical protein